MTGETYNIKQYNRRWVNLFLFVIFAINNGVHWAQYTIINDSVATYYHVPHAYVEWTSGLFNLSYVLLVAPGLYALSKIVKLLYNFYCNILFSLTLLHLLALRLRSVSITLKFTNLISAKHFRLR